MAFSADGQTLAFAGHRGDGQIKIIERWDIKSRTSISTPIRLTEPVSHLALSPDGKRLALAGEGTSLTLWDFASAPFSQTLPGHQSNIEHVVFSANDHNILASSAQDGTIILWDLSADSLILQQHTANITDLAFSPDGDVLISAGKDGAVMFWDTKTGVLSRDPLRYTDVVQDLAFSSDGQTLALADSAGILTLWDIAADEVSGYEVRGTFPIGYGGIQALAFSEDTSTLTLLAADTGAVTRWAVDPSEWKETACALAGRNLTWREWNGAFSGDDAVYTKTCEAYPVHPTVVDAKIAEGERDVRQLKIEEARAAFEEANELSETPVWGGEEAMGAEDAIINVLFDVARERFLLGNFEKAGEYLQVIHDLDPTQIPDVEIALEAGRSLEQGRGAIAKAEYDEALSALNRAVELDPQFVVNQQSDLATLYYKVCRGLLDTSVPRARSTCERAVALAGEIEDLMLNLEICQGSEVEALTEVVSPSCHRAVSLADEISFGDAVTRDLEEDSFWTFEGRAGQRFRITMDAMSAGLDPYLRLFRPDGNLMTEDDDGGEGYNARISDLTLPQDGAYIVQAQGLSGSFGRYTLSLAEVSLERIASGEPVTRDLAANIIWTFEGHRGQMFRISMDAVSDDLDPYLRLLGPGGGVDEDHDSGGGRNARMDILLPQNGDYIIQTEGRAGSSGRYVLSLEEASPERITFGDTVVQDLEVESFWAFEGHAGEWVRISMDAVSNGLDPYLHLVGPNKYIIFEDDDGGEGINARIDGFMLPQDGTYAIHAKGEARLFGRYVLSLEEVMPERITVGDAITRDLEAESLWTFAGHAGQIVRITMDAVSPDLDPYLRLLGPGGGQIAEDYDSGGGNNARLDGLILPQDGDYIIHTQGAAGPFGSYRLSLEEVTPERVALGDAVTRDLEEESLWTFAGHAGQIIRITMDAVSPNLDPYLCLLGPGGYQITEDYDGGEGNNARIDGVILPQDGDYIIHAQGAAGPFGRYRLSLEEVTPEPIAYGEPVTRSLEENSLWTFAGHAGQIVRITMDAVSPELDPSLGLLGPDGYQIAWDDNGGGEFNARLDSVILPQDGAYIIHTQGAAGPFGSYRLSLEEVTPERVALGDAVTRDLEEESLWTFAGHAGQIIRITMDAVSPDLDPSLGLLGPDGNQIAWDDDGGGEFNARLDSVILPQDGDYIIHAQDAAEPFGRYRLSLEEVTPEPIAYGEPVTRSLEENSLWTFEGQAGQIIRITMDAVSPDLDRYLHLLRPDGSFVAEDYDSGGALNARLDGFILPQDGAYIIRAQGAAGPFGRYRLSLEDVTPEPIVLGDAVTGSLEEDSLWTFVGHAGQIIRIAMDAASNDLDPSLRLLDPDGNQIAWDGDSGEGNNARIDGVILLQDGAYIIHAQGAAGPFGRYALSLEEITPEPIALGDPVTRDLEENSFWAFEGHAGQMIRITMDAVSDYLDPYLRLLGSDGNQIAWDDNGGGGNNARLDSVILPQDGVYIIHAQGNAGPFGRYKLLLDEVPTETIAFGESVDGDFEDGIAWTFEAQVGHMISVELHKTFSDQEAQLVMVLPDSTHSANRDREADTVTAKLVVPMTGVYRVFPQGEGAYTLSLTAMTATASISHSGVISAMLTDPLGDHWAFSDDGVNAISLTMSSDAFEPYLEFYGPDGMLQQRDTGSGPDGHASLHFVPGTGTYSIVARGAQEEATGPYTLTLTRTAALPQMCGMAWDAIDYGPIAVGSEVILGHHRAVNGDSGWYEMMDPYVGEQAQVTALSGVDGQGCPGVRVDVDNGSGFWRIRDLYVIGP
jgi:tetratricopeptide (TPR) repeat protein